MSTRRGGRLAAVATVLAAVVLSACGSGASTASLSASLSTPSAGTSTAAPTASPTRRALNDLDPLVFPDKDTPFKDANATLQGIWKTYQVTLIPGRHTLDGLPPVPKVSNLTHGAIDDPTAQNFLEAEYRDNAFSAWAEKNVQPDFLNKLLAGPVYEGSTIVTMLRQGIPILDPPCDLYPVSAAVVVLDGPTQAYFTSRKIPTSGPFAIVQTANGPCDVVARTPQGDKVLGSISPQGETDLVAGHLVHDPRLGDLWFSDGSFNCDKSDAPKELCAAARF